MTDLTGSSALNGSGAIFSPCGKYRYALWRQWGDLLSSSKGSAMFVGLNPSTADTSEDDPTIRRCIGFARSWGFDGLVMANLFAFRSTDPAEMLASRDPIGRDNDQHLQDLARRAAVVVAAWGVHGAHLQRDRQVRQLLPQLHYLRLTKDGQPGHPLYLPKSLSPTAWLTTAD